nr:MAG TPA: hypothetical protein [Caudoviricetes sp.]
MKYKKRQASANACQGEKVKIYTVYIISPSLKKARKTGTWEPCFLLD